MKAETKHPEWMSTLVNTAKYSDLLITCGDREFRVHRNIIGSQSETFENLIDNLEDSSTSAITLEEDSHAFSRLIIWMYTGEYEDNPLSTAMRSSEVAKSFDFPHAFKLNTMVYLLAQKFQIPDLQALAIDKFQFTVASNFDKEQFTAALRYLYENDTGFSQGHSLKYAFLTSALNNRVSLLRAPDFRDLLLEYSAIGLDLFKTEPLNPVIGKLAVLPPCVSPFCSGDGVFRCANCDIGVFYKMDGYKGDIRTDLVCGNTSCQTKFVMSQVYCTERCKLDAEEDAHAQAAAKVVAEEAEAAEMAAENERLAERSRLEEHEEAVYGDAAEDDESIEDYEKVMGNEGVEEEEIPLPEKELVAEEGVEA